MKFTLPHDPFTPLDPNALPTARTVRQLRKEVYTNLCAVPSDLGGGNHGHLGMVMPQAKYITISNGGVAYVHPAPPVPPIYAGAAAIIATQQAQFNKMEKDYYEYRDLSNQIKAMLVQAIPITFIRPLSDPTLGFANATPESIMTHLFTEFGKIRRSDLAANLKELDAPWNPDTPIQDVFARGTFCREFAVEGRDPITDMAYIRALLQVFEKSGVLEKAIDDWDNKDEADQTLVNCELHFIEANRFRLSKLSKDSKEVLAANNAVQEAPKEAPKDLQALVADAVAKATKEAFPKQADFKGSKELLGLCYCWSCGICDHPGWKCKNKKEGHKNRANIYKRLGGNNTINVTGNPNKKKQDRENQNPNSDT
jgi:hypothetical protein